MNICEVKDELSILHLFEPFKPESEQKKAKAERGDRGTERREIKREPEKQKEKIDTEREGERGRTRRNKPYKSKHAATLCISWPGSSAWQELPGCSPCLRSKHISAASCSLNLLLPEGLL